MLQLCQLAITELSRSLEFPTQDVTILAHVPGALSVLRTVTEDVADVLCSLLHALRSCSLSATPMCHLCLVLHVNLCLCSVLVPFARRLWCFGFWQADVKVDLLIGSLHMASGALTLAVNRFSEDVNTAMDSFVNQLSALDREDLLGDLDVSFLNEPGRGGEGPNREFFQFCGHALLGGLAAEAAEAAAASDAAVGSALASTAGAASPTPRQQFLPLFVPSGSGATMVIRPRFDLTGSALEEWMNYFTAAGAVVTGTLEVALDSGVAVRIVCGGVGSVCVGGVRVWMMCGVPCVCERMCTARVRAGRLIGVSLTNDQVLGVHLPLGIYRAILVRCMFSIYSTSYEAVTSGRAAPCHCLLPGLAGVMGGP